MIGCFQAIHRVEGYAQWFRIIRHQLGIIGPTRACVLDFIESSNVAWQMARLMDMDKSWYQAL